MLKAKDVKVGNRVWFIKVFGHALTGYDMQILSYVVKYKGEDKFIPEGFRALSEDFQEISYSDCFKTLDDAKKDIEERSLTPVSFVDHEGYSDVI